MTAHAWNDVVTTALIGTERRPLTTGSELLASIALETTRRRAGVALNEGVRSFTPSPPEHRPEASPKAMQLLDLALGNQFGPGTATTLAAEWVRSCSESGKIAAREAVPALLELGTAHDDLRPAVTDVIGERGRWLAGRSDRWRWVQGNGDIDTATTGDLVPRARAARAADPPAGRDLIATLAEGRPAAERAMLYAELAAGLEPDDEPLLESLLDDRSQQVKAVAVDLLARLPASRFSQRMTTRLEPLVRVGGMTKRLEVDLPGDLDDHAARDGIGSPPPSGIGVAAWQLRQIVAGVPLAWWTRRTGATPDRLAARPPSEQVVAGWIEATGRQHDPVWAAALFDHAEAISLLRLIRADERDRRLIVAAKRADVGSLTSVLALCPGPWSPAATKAVLDRVWAIARSDKPGTVVPMLDSLSRCDPDAVDRMARIASHLQPAAQRTMRAAINTLSFRTSLQEEFS